MTNTKNDIAIPKDVQDLLKKGSIRSQLPAEFQLDEGSSTLEWFNVTCRYCQERIPDRFLRGTINNSMKNFIIIRAGAYCPTCRHLFRVTDRMHPDFTTDQLINGQWVRQINTATETQSIIKRIFNRIRTILHKGQQA